MSKLVWDQTGSRFYETGVKNCVLYVKGSTGYETGVAWNGITGITESPSGAEETALYADDKKYLSLRSVEEIGATIEAYTYPDEFAECDGSAEMVTGVTIGQQSRKMFCICYKTTVGNDTDANDHGYKLHILYNCTASPSQKAYATINESPEAITFSWEVTTTPMSVSGYKDTASIVIDSTKLDQTGLTNLETLEGYLYGTDGSGSGTGTDPIVKTPDEIYAIFSNT